LQLTLFM